MLLKGERKLTSRAAELLAAALELKGRRRALFLAFAKADSGRGERERSQARDEILRLKSYRPEYRLKATQYSFLATWYYPALYALLENLPGPLSAEQIAKAFGRGVTPAAVEKALRDLCFLELVEKDASGAWKPKHSALTTPEDVRDLAIGRYHRNTLTLAEEALELPLHAREFNGLTVTIPRRLVPEVKKRVQRFRDELNDFLSQSKDPGEVFQLNLHLFPLTKGLDRSDT
jgi:uncharacterized protein (TIGR02147 family)